jgi:hypothetical protein
VALSIALVRFLNILQYFDQHTAYEASVKLSRWLRGRLRFENLARRPCPESAVSLAKLARDPCLPHGFHRDTHKSPYHSEV